MDLVNLVVVDSTVNTTSTSTKTAASTVTIKTKKIKTSKVKTNAQKKSTTATATTTTTNHNPTTINASQLIATKMAAIETVTSSSEQMKISMKSNATSTATATASRIVTEINEKSTGSEKMASANSIAVDTSDKNMTGTTAPATAPSTVTDGVNGLKKKSKKMKRLEAEKENISVRSSFSKFDALQKKNLIHVRSSDPGKIQEKLFDGGDISKLTKCAVCAKPVYKMEEIKAEKNIYHRNCFRCHECDKQLSVDTYQSHESVLYCKLHFKILFAPKVVEDSKLDKPRKPELIIRENQPDELPPDVVRASDKPNLGLEELQELNVRSKFQVFENSIEKQQVSGVPPPSLPVVTGVKRSTSIISKLAKLQSKGFITGLSADDMMIAMQENSTNKSNPDSGNDQSNDDDCDINSSDKSVDGDDNDDDHDDDDDDDDGEETDLVRCKKRTQRERPVGLVGRAMSDIKTKFENGHIMSKEERREERKQELQNIRSRLFLGKQARIKEMYQQAVADSEQLVTSTGKKSEIEIGDKARSLKEKFEKGEIFRDHGSDKEENNNNNSNNNNAIDDADVFESAISKKSRSMFMELDASAIAEKTQLQQQQQRQTMRRKSSVCEQNDQDKHSIDSNGELTPTKTTKAFQQRQHQPSDNVVKHDEKTDDVQIQTSEISSKFKFFETYRPTENQKKLFRITPPREGVVKLPSPESDDGRSFSPAVTPVEPAEQIHTTTIMLNKFREMEQSKKHHNNEDYGPKPLKCFTPPPNDGRRNNQENDSNDDYSGEDDDEDDDDESDDYAEDEDDNNVNNKHIYDEALREAQLAARAKKLREKFEKWEASEIQREMNDDAKFIYADQCADGSTIESTKLIRERFENLNNSQPNATARPRYKVNRFV